MPAQDRTVSAVVTELNNIASILDAAWHSYIGKEVPYSELAGIKQHGSIVLFHR